MLLLGVEPLADRASPADELREREAASVAAAVRAAIDERWPVDDGNDDGVARRARLGDICILLPARTSLHFLERALDDAGIPYRAETSSLVYGTREVRDLLMTLRAVDDPSDALALVSALRSSVFGCGDDDLFGFHVEHGGRWDVRRAAARVAAGRPSGRRRGSLPRRAAPGAHVGDAERAARADRARAPRARGRRRLPAASATSPGGCGS